MNIRVNPSKFLPPTLRDDQTVARSRLLKQAAHRTVGKRCVLVEGQPGQGKTTFTHQFVKYLDKPFFWYRIEQEDNDPLYLASGLLYCLKSIHHDCDFSLSAQVIEGGGAECFEIGRILGLLFQPARHCVPKPGAVVFDDLHLLENKGLGRELLKGFIGLLPSPISVFCVSRSKIFPDDDPLRKSSALLDNTFLSFKSDEAGKLFRDVFELELSSRAVDEALEMTRGWPMGLVMAGNELSQSGGSAENLQQMKSIDDYFSVAVRPKVSDKRWSDLLKLSLLDEFAAPLVARILDEKDTASFIDKLVERNFFLRRLGPEGRWYEFHHLFLDFLRSRSEREIGPEERRRVLSAAADWCIENGEFEKALAYTIRHGDLDTTEEMLKIVGLQLFAANRLVTLHRALGAIQREEVGKRGILALFAGLSMVGVDPQHATMLIESSAAIFRRDGEPFWELVASSQALFCHMMITFNFHMGRPHLERAMALVDDLMPVMPPEGQSFVYNAMALGQHYILGNGELSYQNAIKAIALADRSGMPNVVASALCGGILCCMGSTRLADGRILLNRARAMVADQRLSSIQRLMLRFLITHYCAIGGDWVNWRFFRKETEECEEAYLLDKGIFRDFFDIEDIDYLLLRGEFLAAEEVCIALLHRSAAHQKMHIRSLALGQYSLVLALSGREEESAGKIAEAWEIRRTIGGDTFRAFQLLYAGAAHASRGDVERTDEYLGGVVEMTRWLLGEYSQAIVNLNRALAYINAGRREEAAPFCQELLNALAKLPIRHLITLHPGSIHAIAESVRLGLKPAPKMEIIRELFGKSVTQEGEIIPAMTVRAFGGLSISWGWGQTALAAGDITTVQRHLLTHLLCAPGFSLEKEVLAARLWPDSQRDKAIANFDMTLSRIRKTVDDILGVKLSRHYLTVRNGMVGLDHCDCDIDIFESSADKGFEMVDGHRGWEGCNKLRNAEHQWNGELLAGLELPDEGHHRRNLLTARYQQVALKLASVYCSMNSYGEAGKTLRRALLSAPADASLNGALYGCLKSCGDVNGAKSVAETYAESLKKAGFSQNEIKTLLEAL